MISNPAMKNNAVAIACNPPSWASIINGTMKKAKRLLFMPINVTLPSGFRQMNKLGNRHV